MSWVSVLGLLVGCAMVQLCNSRGLRSSFRASPDACHHHRPHVDTSILALHLQSLLDPSLPRDMDGGGRTQQTITEDEAMYVWPAATAKLHLCLFRWLTTSTADRFLLQKRLVVRQYKYVLYLQQMTYVLVLVLFCKYMCTARLPGPLLRAVPA